MCKLLHRPWQRRTSCTKHASPWTLVGGNALTWAETIQVQVTLTVSLRFLDASVEPFRKDGGDALDSNK